MSGILAWDDQIFKRQNSSTEETMKGKKSNPFWDGFLSVFQPARPRSRHVDHLLKRTELEALNEDARKIAQDLEVAIRKFKERNERSR